MNQEACPRCGAPRAAATPFCTNCGTPFSSAPGATPSDAPTMVGGPPSGQGPAWGAPGDQPGSPYQDGAAQWGAGSQPGAPQGGSQWGPPQGPGGPGQWGPGPQSGGGGNRGKIALIIGIVLLVLIGGGIAAALVLADDDDDDNEGGGSKGGSSKSVSTEEFCNLWDELDDLDSDDPDDFAEGKAHLGEIADRGTPADMPDDAREGFEVYMGMIEKMDSPDDALTAGAELSEEEQRRMQSFFTYLSESCDSEGDAPTVTVPTDIPTDIPTDFPTDFPSDLESFDPSDYGLDEDSLRELEELESMLAELSEYASPE